MFETKDLLLTLILGGAIQLIGGFSGSYGKKVGNIIEIILGIGALGYIFYQHEFTEAFIYISMLSIGYFSLSMITAGKEMYHDVELEINANIVRRIELVRQLRRIIIDYSIVGIVFLGAILFYLFGPESPIKFFIVLALVTAITELVRRTIAYRTTRIYYHESDKQLLILSRNQSRRIPISDIKHLQMESTVDILRLHPLLTMFSSSTDLTTSLGHVVKLELPGETIYFTPIDPSSCIEMLDVIESEEKTIGETRKVLPFYHWRNIKRLLGKLYFAITVKGVSAYTGLLLILYFLDVPVWIIAIVSVGFWIFNLYISDQVLKIAMDAHETTDQEMIQLSQKVFEKAGIPNVRVCETETNEYNGLATGMNIGKSMVTLTTATLKLPKEAIEAILAHEAIHIKKRDVLWGQLFRLLYMVILGVVVWVLSENRNWIEDFPIITFFVIWFFIFFFQIYQSFYSQWMEVRADHLGGTLVEGGHLQMAEGLRTLATEQDKAINKSIQYSTVADQKQEEISSLKRDSLIWRLIEFQFMLHPPMYWRVKVLEENKNGWGKAIVKRWFVDRFKESFTFGKNKNE